MTKTYVDFLTAVKDITAGNPKIKKSDVFVNGSLPVVDQGKDLISGFVSNPQLAVKKNSPVIVFGDHTRVFKYLDFDFAIGADGTKVFEPRQGFLPKYLYRYFESIILPNWGYSRHFKALKEVPVPKPPLDEQRRIAAILDQADAIRAKRQQQLEHHDSLVESVFQSMFSQERSDVTVGEIAADAKGSIRTGPFGSQLRHSEFVNSGVAVLGLDNVVGNSFRWGERRYITHEKYETLKRYTVHPGDVLISIMGTVGRCAVVPQDIPLAINTKHICAITPNQNIINPSFLRAAFLWHPVCRTHLRRQTKGAIMAGLNMGIIKSMPVPLPALERQNEFAKVSFTITTQRHHLQRALDRDNELFASLQSRAFRGEL